MKTVSTMEEGMVEVVVAEDNPPSPTPTPTTCPANDGWYNIIPPPPCDVPNPGNSDDDNPCEQADKLEKNTGLKDKFTALKNKTNQNKEYGYMYKINSDITVNAIEIEGEANAAGIDVTITEKFDGFIHSHYTGLLSVFSRDDIYAMAKMYIGDKMIDPSTFTAGVVTASGTQYILKIDDIVKFKAYAENMVNNNAIEDLSDLYDKFYKITPKNSKEQNEKAFLQYLQQTKSGLRLFKGNDNFNDWQPKKVDANNNVVDNPC
ncbi:MAG: hypothetical protein IPJ81_04690 [Chitinophagaceae bacterium]|nr:hypothetical protein [Chitinophagaceae bacterium]